MIGGYHESGVSFYMPLKHRLIANSDGGYFYRFYPRLSSAIGYSKDQLKSIQTSLFNPLPSGGLPNVVHSLYGQFYDKYEEKGKRFIRLLSKAEYSITCELTNNIEIRKLQSFVEIEVDKDFYDYAFDKKKVYSLTVDTITEL